MSNLYRNKISRVFAKYAKRGMGHVSKPCLMDVGSEADATIATLTAERDAQSKQVRELVELVDREHRRQAETDGFVSYEIVDAQMIAQSLAAKLKEQDDE